MDTLLPKPQPQGVHYFLGKGLLDKYHPRVPTRVHFGNNLRRGQEQSDKNAQPGDCHFQCPHGEE